MPVFRALFQDGVYIGWLSMTPSLTRPPQNVATFWVAASSMATFHLSPEVVHHLAPACWARPAKRPESLAEKVVRSVPGETFFSWRAVSANCSQVVGTVSLYFLNRSAR